MARRELRGNRAVSRWEQTDDVLQGALVRPHRALETLTPDSARHFFALAAQQMRRTLRDLYRHLCGRQGQGHHHATPAPHGPAASDVATAPAVPEGLDQWTAFHEQAELLPDD